MEPVTVASYRHLPTIHPLWKLLSPHIRGVLAINTFGRGRLIADGGVADNTLSVGGGGTYVVDNFVKKGSQEPWKYLKVLEFFFKFKALKSLKIVVGAGKSILEFRC